MFRWFAKRFLHPAVVSIYDYIFLWDEDLGVKNFHPGRYNCIEIYNIPSIGNCMSFFLHPFILEYSLDLFVCLGLFIVLGRNSSYELTI